MYPKIFLREDQTFEVSKYQDGNVLIVAPEWVKKGLEILSKYIPAGTKFEIYDSYKREPISELIIDHEPLTLRDLIMIARNEPVNVTGVIEFQNYLPLIEDKNVIYALKDLVRQCVIVALDETTHYGRFSARKKQINGEPVYVIDLAALQFQQNYNSGRLVLIGKHLTPFKGLLDELIFEEVVGEKRKASLEEVARDTSGRYVKQTHDIYFDTIAYKKFVEYDVILSGFALNLFAKQPVNFKFLKYGTGFFAGNYSEVLEDHIYDGVANGLDKLFSNNLNLPIKHVELPFYKYNKNIDNVCKKHNIKCRFSHDDALKRTHQLYVTATTNCADPHAMTGNEMGYASVDATIGENLKSKANNFSPILNPMIQEKFVKLCPNQHH